MNENKIRQFSHSNLSQLSVDNSRWNMCFMFFIFKFEYTIHNEKKRTNFALNLLLARASTHYMSNVDLFELSFNWNIQYVSFKYIKHQIGFGNKIQRHCMWIYFTIALINFYCIQITVLEMCLARHASTYNEYTFSMK